VGQRLSTHLGDRARYEAAKQARAVFGARGQKRADFANEVASDVLGCWTEDE
jgi:hypothetical protein